MKARAILVDDHNLVRRGLRMIVEKTGLEVVGEGATGADALALVDAQHPDLVLLDVHLSDLNGIEVARRLLAANPSLKIILITAESDNRFVTEALHVGVMGYILKETAPDVLSVALETVLAGDSFLCPEVSALVVRNYRQTLLNHDEPRPPALSERERQVLRLIADGLRNKEIADRLEINIKTAETYRARLCKKLGVSGTAELVRYALRSGIAPP
jgi:DNA-binding NarL/FixJ family response regulator